MMELALEDLIDILLVKVSLGKYLIVLLVLITVISDSEFEVFLLKPCCCIQLD